MHPEAGSHHLTPDLKIHRQGELSIHTFLAWLACVQIFVMVRKEVLENLHEFMTTELEKTVGKGKPLIISIVHHRSHYDGKMVSDVLKILFPKIYEKLVFLAAEETWKKPLKRKVAESLGAPFRLFKRDATRAEKEDQQKALVSDLKEGVHQVIGLFPEGGRDEDRPVETLPLILMKETQGKVLVINLKETKQVIPKLQTQGMAQLKEIIQRLRERIPQAIKGMAHVHIEIHFEELLDNNEKILPLRRKFLSTHEKADQPTTSCPEDLQLVISYEGMRQRIRVVSPKLEESH